VLLDNLPPMPHRGVHNASTELPHFGLGLNFIYRPFIDSVGTSQKIRCLLITRTHQTANAIRESNRSSENVWFPA
jgi:hypothetical protein